MKRKELKEKTTHQQKASNAIQVYLHYTAQSPDIRFTAVPLFVKNLRRQVVWSSTDCSDKKKKALKKVNNQIWNSLND